MAETETSFKTIRKAAFDRAPTWLAVLAFSAGAFALISAAIPDGLVPPQKPFLRVLAEAPTIALSIGGLALMVLSLGLLRRIYSAWALTAVIALHGVVATVFLRPRPAELIIYLALAAVLLATRKAFYRRSSLATIIIPRLWILASMFILAVASFAALLWVSHQSGFVEASFLDLLIDPDLGIAGRPVVVAGLILGLALLYFGIASPNWPKPEVANRSDFQHITQLLEASDHPRPDNILAYAGDKSVFYGPNKQAALTYMDYGGSRIAMGTPIGPQHAWKETLRSFKEDAEASGLRPAIYSVPPDLLPDLHELDFKFEKIGENAILELSDFSLSGRKREVIRRSRRKLVERQSATFELSLPPHKAPMIDDLRRVSDLWLKENGAREKSFSLGHFEPEYLKRCPIGIVRIEGHVVAFGSLMATPNKHWVGIDLMRYDPENAVTNTMDFLLVELILWARNQGYAKFDLAMVPLSGLIEEDVAALFAQFGQFVFERGERFYNFQGLRRFKQKFNPQWEPRYIAAPGYWTLPILLAQVAFLTNSKMERPEQLAQKQRAIEKAN